LALGCISSMDRKRCPQASSAPRATAMPSRVLGAGLGRMVRTLSPGVCVEDHARVYGKVVAAWHFCWMPGPKAAIARPMIVASAMPQVALVVTEHLLKPGIAPTLP